MDIKDVNEYKEFAEILHKTMNVLEDKKQFIAGILENKPDMPVKDINELYALFKIAQFTKHINDLYLEIELLKIQNVKTGQE